MGGLQLDQILDRLEAPVLPVDVEVDLRGVERKRALRILRRTIEDGRYGAPERMRIRIDTAVHGAGETLFLPVGRMLLEARRRGIATRLLLASGHGSGFYICLRGGEEDCTRL